MVRQIVVMVAAIVVCTAFAVSASADEKTVTGTLEDSFCYVTMGAHGAGHRECAITCAKKGIPVALVEKGSDDMYILLPPKNAEPLPENVIDKMEQQVTVTGNSYSKGGLRYLTVNSIK